LLFEGFLYLPDNTYFLFHTPHFEYLSERGRRKGVLERKYPLLAKRVFSLKKRVFSLLLKSGVWGRFEVL
jgi:hypothetical protein